MLPTLSPSIGILIVVWGTLNRLVELLKAEFLRFKQGDKKSLPLATIRLDIGRYLLLGLEFLIAADITLTILSPSLEEIAILASIVAIRTVISYFITREISQKQDIN